MAEEKETSQPVAPTVDIEAIVRETAAEAVKAYQASLPIVDRSGHDVTVTESEEDRALAGNPYKGLGEFLMDVADATKGGLPDQRLMPLQSKDADMRGFFDMSAAVPQVVGSSRDARKSLKAPTGLGELIPQDGGFLVGTDRQSTIMSRVYGVGQLLSRIDTVTISANSNGMTFYREAETSRVDGSRRGGIRAYHAAEAAEKTASHPTFDEMELKLYKIIGLVYATDELLADASALEGWIMSNLPEELRFVAENDVIRGTGAGMAMGILNSGCLVTQGAEVGQAADTVVAENITNMWSRRWARKNDYVWLINQDVEPQLDYLALAVGVGGQLVYMPAGGLSGRPYATLKGAPVLTVEYCSTVGTVGDIILASLSEYQAIDKGGMQSASSIHVRFVNDESVFRFVMRFDGQPKWGAPLTPFQGVITQSPFVALATR